MLVPRILILAVTLSAVTGEQPECDFMCPKTKKDMCYLVETLSTHVTAHDEYINKNDNVIKKAETFFRDVHKSISDVVNILVEENVNSVMRDAAVPEGPTETDETDSALERTSDYISRALNAMKNLSSELKRTADRTEALRRELAEAEKRRSEEAERLSARLAEVETATKGEMRRLENASREAREGLAANLRSEISPRLRAMEEKLELYKNIAEMEKNLANLHTEIGKGESNDNATAQADGKCADGAYPGYCQQIVEANYCRHEYYGRVCCAACAKAGKLPSD